MAAVNILIDIHVHTAEYSCDSTLRINDAVERAIEAGLDGICVTDHESLGVVEVAADLTRRSGLLVIPGAEINTFEGDFLVFGLAVLPIRSISARELIKLVNMAGGFAVAAHPFRNNGRGAGSTVTEIGSKVGIEVLNGRTDSFQNRQAMDLAARTGFPCLGGSDAHNVFEIGRFATRFDRPVRGLKDFIEASRNGETTPVFDNGFGYEPVQGTDLFLPGSASPIPETAAFRT